MKPQLIYIHSNVIFKIFQRIFHQNSNQSNFASPLETHQYPLARSVDGIHFLNICVLLGIWQVGLMSRCVYTCSWGGGGEGIPKGSCFPADQALLCSEVVVARLFLFWGLFIIHTGPRPKQLSWTSENVHYQTYAQSNICSGGFAILFHIKDHNGVKLWNWMVHIFKIDVSPTKNILPFFLFLNLIVYVWIYMQHLNFYK